MQEAETWDVEATEATMIQFDLYGSCSDDHHNSFSPGVEHWSKQNKAYKRSTKPLGFETPKVSVEYSTNNGQEWHLVRELCAPPDTSCEGYDLGSVFSIPREEQTLQREKRRVMLEMPREAA